MTEPQAQQVASPLARIGMGPRLAWWVLGAAAVVGLLVLGFQREARIRRALAVLPAARLHFGQTAPPFSLATAAGGEVSSDSLKGKWSLLVFCSSSCPYTQKALESLTPFHQRWKERLNIVCIVPESARSAQRVGRWGNFPVLLDPDLSVHGFYDNPLQSPSFILLDADGRVRFTEQGFASDCKGKSTFVSLLGQFFEGKGDLLEPLEAAADGVVVVDGSQRRLSELWTGGTLVLAFIAPGQPASMSLLGRSARFREGPDSMKFLFLSPGKPDSRWKGLPIKGTRFLAGWDESGDLVNAYEVNSFPRMFMIRDGYLIGERGKDCSRCSTPWGQVAEAALFTCSPKPVREGGRKT